MAALILFVLLSVTLAHGSCPDQFEEVGTGDCCFYFSNEEDYLATWSESRDYCHELGVILGNTTVDLAEVDTSSSCNSDALMDTIYSKDKGLGFWMGGSDVMAEDTWVWQYSQEILPLSSSRWGSGLPWGGTEENCLAADGYYYDTAQFYDGYCTTRAWFVCQ
ncbi:unnamed protein product, partial [Meganyctiphanes norvegica]